MRLLNPRRCGNDRDPEAGRAGLLLLVCLLVVILIVQVGAALTALQVQKSRLLTCADVLSAAGAQAVEASEYYSAARTGAPDPAGVDVARARVLSVLGSLDSGSCRVGEGVVVDSVEVRGLDVVVNVSTRARLPLLPGALGSVVAPVLSEGASARMW